MANKVVQVETAGMGATGTMGAMGARGAMGVRDAMGAVVMTGAMKATMTMGLPGSDTISSKSQGSGAYKSSRENYRTSGRTGDCSNV